MQSFISKQIQLNFSEYIKAIRDVWLVDDSFLRGMWTTIIGTKNKAKLKNTAPPYIFDKYNVLPLYAVSSSLNKSCLGRMHNQFIEGLNEIHGCQSMLYSCQIKTSLRQHTIMDLVASKCYQKF